MMVNFFPLMSATFRGVRAFATDGGRGTFHPMIQVFLNAKTGQWKRVQESPKSKDAIEWLRPSLFSRPKMVDLEGQSVSVLLSMPDRGWVRVDLEGKVKK